MITTIIIRIVYLEIVLTFYTPATTTTVQIQIAGSIQKFQMKKVQNHRIIPIWLGNRSCSSV